MLLLAGILAGIGACSSYEGGALAGDVDAGTADIAVDAPCVDGLVLTAPGVCAPPLPQCDSPWELPLVEGGCLAVGPRACPRGWDPEAEVDCAAGELLPCPDGFVLTDDEVACIPFFEDDCLETAVPILGGGCRDVGPRWGQNDLEEPQFDACPPRELAWPGGGCVTVGPRACPALWNPAADVICTAGELRPCPQGWSPAPDNTHCEPGYPHCPPGGRAVPGACVNVIPAKAECPEGTYPDPPAEAAGVVFVSAGSECTTACGSIDAPFSSIQEGVDAVADDGWVLVSEGDYEAFVVGHPAGVAGVCASKVLVTKAIAVPPAVGSKVETASIIALNASSVEISGIGVQSSGAGLVLVGADQFEVTDVEVAGGAGVGVFVSGKSTGSLSGLWIHDTQPGNGPGLQGEGIWIEDGSQVEVRQVLVEMARKSGVFVKHGSTSVSIVDSTIRNTLCNSSGTWGAGVFANAGTALTLENTLLEGNRTQGVVAGANCVAAITECVVRETTPDEYGANGAGIEIGPGAALQVTDSFLSGNAGGGVLVSQADADAHISGSVIEGTVPNPGSGPSGFGVVATQGGKVELSGSLIVGNSSAGVVAQNPGTLIELEGCIVTETQLAGDGKFGHGVNAGLGSEINIAASVVEDNMNIGVATTHGGTGTTVERSVIRGTMPVEAGKAAHGLTAGSTSTVQVTDSLIEDNGTVGAMASELGTKLTLRSVMVRGNGVGPLAKETAGVAIIEQAEAHVQGCVLEGNGASNLAVKTGGNALVEASTVRDAQPVGTDDAGFGILATGGAQVAIADSLLEISDLMGSACLLSAAGATLNGVILRGTNSTTSSGSGLRARDGTQVSLTDCLLEGNLTKGVLVIDPGTVAKIQGGTSRQSDGSGSGTFATVAILAQEGAELTVADTLLTAATYLGIVVSGNGTSAHVRRSAFKPDHAGLHLAGAAAIATMDSTDVTVDSCLIHAAPGAGISIYDDAHCRIAGTVIRDTVPSANGAGAGLSANHDAVVSVEGCLLEGNHSVSMFVWGKLEPDDDVSGADAKLRGTIVRKTTAHGGEEELGMGLAILAGGKADVGHCLIEDNGTAGIFVLDDGSSASVSNSSLQSTATGGAEPEVEGTFEGQVFGDGLFAGNDASVDISSTLVMGNSRCGVYLENSVGVITDSVIALNSSFGLAMADCAEDVQHQGKGNIIAGNALSLPPNLAAEITASPSGLPVPPVPEVGPMPSAR